MRIPFSCRTLFSFHILVVSMMHLTVDVRIHAADDSQTTPVDRTSELELLEDDFGLADGPAWDGKGYVFVPDVKRSLIRRFDVRQNSWATIHEGEFRYSASFYSHNKLILSNNTAARIESLATNRPAAQPDTVFTIDESDPVTRKPNDLVVDHSGGIYFTLTRQNQVIYVSPSGESQVVSEAVESPNGITLSPDQKTLYVAAYRPKKIIALPLKSPGTAGDAVEFSFMDDGKELGADGMTIDRAGNVYCAGATDVWIWNADGKLLDRINCPTRPINCAFGDQDLRSLYITAFGGVYRQRMTVSGRPPERSPNPPQASSNLPSTAVPDGITANLDVVYAQYGPRKVLTDIFVPESPTGPKPTIVVVHGGGWLNGDKSKFRALAIRLAEKGFVTAAIEYRLGGEAKFPAGMHDCSAAVRFLRTNADEFSIDPERIAAVGGSAGGHLVGLMATGWDDDSLHGNGGNPGVSSRLQAAIVMAGPLQIATGSVADKSHKGGNGSNAIQWIGKTIDEAPGQYLLADAFERISGDTCPVLFMTGEHDNPERNSASRKKLKGTGVATDIKIYKDGKHGCWNRLPWFNDMADDIATWLHNQMPASQ